MKMKKVCSGIYEVTVNGIVYVVERRQSDSTGYNDITWTWYDARQYAGNDAYTTKRDAIEALQAYLNR
jgi:hypothetical protein